MRKKLFLSLLILYASLSLNAQTIITSDRTVAENAPSVRLSIMGGGGCRLGKAASNTEAALADHAKHTRWGVSYGADASWFFSESLGAGLRYNNLHVGHKTEVTATYDDGSSRSGLLEDQINIWFLGPQCSFRLMNATKKNAFYLTYGLGYIGYHDSAKLIDPYTIKGGTLGYLAEIGYDIGLSKHLAIGASFSLYNGTLRNVNITESSGEHRSVSLEKDKYEGLGHLDLAIGLRYML